MRQRYVRVPAQRKDTVAAIMLSGIFAAGVGAVTFYLTRVLLAREPLIAGGEGDGEVDGMSDEEGRALTAGDGGPSGGGA